MAFADFRITAIIGWDRKKLLHSTTLVGIGSWLQLADSGTSTSYVSTTKSTYPYRTSSRHHHFPVSILQTDLHATRLQSQESSPRPTGLLRPKGQSPTFAVEESMLRIRILKAEAIFGKFNASQPRAASVDRLIQLTPAMKSG